LAKKEKIPQPDPCKDYTRKDGKWYWGGKEVDVDTAEALNKQAIPPAWTDVVAARDPDAEMLAMGRDGSGKWQYKYAKWHDEKVLEEKFVRVRTFAENTSDIRHSYKKGIPKDDPIAWALKIEDETAIRIGTELKKNVSPETRAYGLTTLTKEHIIIEGDKVRLDFVAKGGHFQSYKITDKEIADYLHRRYNEMKAGESLFPTVSAEDLNAHLRKITGEYLKFHDFRGYHGTRIANEILAKYAGQALNDQKKLEIAREVCDAVSNFLHNTPKVAFEHYIDPWAWNAIGGIDREAVVFKKPKISKEAAAKLKAEYEKAKMAVVNKIKEVEAKK
jgi:DNA topoisomerase I